MTKKLIGRVGVDSGQLMVCDPCYIDSGWQLKDFEDVRKYKDTRTGKIYEFRVHFDHYQNELEGFDGLTPNALIESGRWVSHKDPRDRDTSFSYNGACQASLSEDAGGELGLHSEGVAFSSGYGDGVYNVYAHYNEDGRIMKVEIDMQ